MFTLAQVNTHSLELARFIPLVPLIGMLICGALGCLKVKKARVLAAPVAILSVAGSFGISLLVMFGAGDMSAFHGYSFTAFEWITVGDFTGNFTFFIDQLTIVMLMVVTGIGTLIAIYASGYMHGDPGYFRFFAYICLFIVAMSILVLGGNLLMLFLGWEGVGLASYLLIGYYYRKPSAVAAAKKAFIVNRVGDFGFALGLMLTFAVFGSIAYNEILPAAAELGPADVVHVDAEAYGTAHAASGEGDHAAVGIHEAKTPSIGVMAATSAAGDSPWKITALLWIPFLLMLGAFGKSAQLPLHVWLPDAMEGPTPVSALIHAATMVTAGVYMIARLLPIFQLSPYALPTVAIIGGVTALFAATIALCQYDIKRVWAYSTVSQLGYMFLGVGVLGAFGGVFHLFTHAFFKALLFLTAGSVMHALAGQLDMRKMSGLFKKMPITAILMLLGCVALAGVPFTAGYYSKDQILYDALNTPGLQWVGWLGVATALLTAFYTFRLWFRVFLGPTEYTMGHEHHGYEMDHAPDDHHHGPHEMPWLMNAPLIILALGALFAGVFGHTWMEQMVGQSTAGTHLHHDHDAPGYISHGMVGAISGGGAILMILLAGYFHWINRDATARIADKCKVVVTFLNNKWYIDELYHYLIVMPLRVCGWVFYLVFDRFILDGLIYDGLLQNTPKLAAEVQAPVQRGKLQGFAVTMGLGVVLLIAIVAYAVL